MFFYVAHELLAGRDALGVALRVHDAAEVFERELGIDGHEFVADLDDRVHCFAAAEAML